MPQPRQIVQVTLSAGTAFKIGFFGAIGAMIAGVIASSIFWIVAIIIFGSFIASLRSIALPSPTP